MNSIRYDLKELNRIARWALKGKAKDEKTKILYVSWELVIHAQNVAMIVHGFRPDTNTAVTTNVAI